MMRNKQSGFTLIELTVVLLILIALAGLAIPYMSGTNQAALCRATDVTMQNVKKVIMERYYLDTLGHFPANDKNATDFNLKYLFTQGGWQDFDPNSQTGWRGSYLQSGVTLGGEYSATKLDASFKDSSSTPNNHVHSDLADNDTVILDGWGRPIILQVNNNIARLVSAGAGNGLGLNNASIDTKITDAARQGDDRILYLNASASDVNPPCDEN